MHRRTFVGASASGVLALAHRAHVRPPRGLRAPEELLTLRDPRVTALGHTALDAARSAGASYADVRLTYTTNRNFWEDQVRKTRVELGLSVRALVNGYWGWAATPYLSELDAPRVGQTATRLAQVAAQRGRPRTVEWGPIPIVQAGTWTTPIRIDPFELAIEEISDWLVAERAYFQDLVRYRERRDEGTPIPLLNFDKQERVFLSTEGSALTQTVYVTGGRAAGLTFPTAQGGWDYVIDPPVRERMRVMLDALDRVPQLPIKRRLEVGRYDIVFTAQSMASLLAATLAPATQVDRVLGYEANAGGTSYLGPDPLTSLGTQIAASLVTITADRSSPRGLATIQWDDDGVVPEDFTLVKDGVLVDYQTTREQATWLAPWYAQHGHSIRSHGCAASMNALTYPMQHTPNLTLKPGTTTLGLEDLIESLDRGLVIDGMGVDMDFQLRNGLGRIGGDIGTVYEVRHGKRVAQFDFNQWPANLQFRAPELWKAVEAVGGPASLTTQMEGYSQKGEPNQDQIYSIAAVPALIRQQAVIDPTRKA